jgi:hypothetical protein
MDTFVSTFFGFRIVLNYPASITRETQTQTSAPVLIVLKKYTDILGFFLLFFIVEEDLITHGERLNLGEINRSLSTGLKLREDLEFWLLSQGYFI